MKIGSDLFEMKNRETDVESLHPFLGLHLFFAANDIAHIDAPADLVHPYSKSADAAFINIALLHTLLRNRLRSFLAHFLLCHD